MNSHCAPGMTPSSGISTAPPFRFRPRRESVDWRRIIAVDINAVVSQIDVDTLQEHISAVTFCSLDSERCPRCQSPVDPALIKLVQLAQLSVEWLLHCQEFLTLNLHSMEERLEAAGKDREQLLAHQKKLEENMKKLNGELKLRKKMIRDQQLMIAVSHKCQHCEKSFLNATYLQKHMQRRHPEEYERALRSDSENNSEIDRLKSETANLKEQIVHLQKALQTKAAQEKEQESLHQDLLRELNRFKAEEIARVDRKIEDNRDGLRREMEFIYTRNIQALNVANQSQSTRPEKSSPVQMEPEKDTNSYKEKHEEAIHKLELQIKKQDKKWESKLQEINTQHDSEINQWRNDLNRMQLEMSELQVKSQRQKQEFGRKLQEKEQMIKSQREQIKTMASNKPVIETKVLHTSAAPEPKPKRVVIEEPPSALMLDPIQELSEEDRESSSVSEAKQVQKKTERVVEKKQRTASSVLKSEPSLRRDIRPELEESLIRRLKSYGVKPSCSGLKIKELNSIMNSVRSERESAAQKMPEYWSVHKDIKKALQETFGDSMRSNENRNKAVSVVNFRSRSSSLPAQATQVKTVSAERQPKTPQPAPRTRFEPQPKTSTPKNKTPWRSYSSMTPPFSSDEESEEEEDDETDTEEELHLDQRNKPNLVQNRANVAPPVQTKQASVSSISSSQSRGVTRTVTQTAVSNVDSEDDEDWSDVSELQEIDPKGLHNFKDQNGNLEKKSFGKENKISELAKKMEKQFTEKLAKKPAGGISILPERKDEVQELSCTDLDESNEWASSSLEEKQDKKIHSSAPLRKSLDSAGTSVWGTSTGKGPRSSLTDSNTGSTLKSSMFSISDVNDDDFSNN